jgi:uncharacterized protein
MSVLTCPVCQGAMREYNRDGILIDSCTQCRGVWLDRGELEKLLAMSRDEPYEAAPRPAAPPPPPPAYGGHPHDSRQGYSQPHRGHDDRYRDQGYDPRYGKRKKSKLESLFDIFD